MRIFTLILPIFYFFYWMLYKEKPFSIIVFILIYITIFLFEMIIAALLKSSSKIIKEKAIDIKNKVKEFDKRLKILENKK